jgi:hypothetical protein
LRVALVEVAMTVVGMIAAICEDVIMVLVKLWGYEGA